MSDGTDSLDAEDVNLVAHLVGTTNAQLKAMDDNIVAPSANLTTSNANWDPKRVIKEAASQSSIRKQNMQNTIPAQQPPPPQYEAAVPHVVPSPTIHQPVPQPVPQHQPTYGGELTIILQKLVEIGDQIKELNSRLGDIEHFDKKVVDSLTRGLQNKVKQVTIKLDESGNK